MNKNILLAAALTFGTIGCGACGSTPTNTVSPVNGNTAVVVNKPAANTTIENVSVKPANPAANVRQPMKTNETLTADTSKSGKIGVAECDEYLAKYEACVNTKVPEAQRAALLTPLETMQKGWKTAATDDKAKAALAGGCKVALTTAKISLSKFSCDW